MCFLCVCVPVFFCFSFAVCSRYCATSVQPTCSGSIILSTRRHLHTIRLIFYFLFFYTTLSGWSSVYTTQGFLLGGWVAIWWYSRKKKQNFAIFICFFYIGEWCRIYVIAWQFLEVELSSFCKRQQVAKKCRIFLNLFHLLLARTFLHHPIYLKLAIKTFLCLIATLQITNNCFWFYSFFTKKWFLVLR